MPSFQDSAFIILLGLLLFGPKGMAKMARQVGKLVGEFRRASAEFRLQMEDELRLSEQEEQQKKIDSMQAAAPVAPPLLGSEEVAAAIPEPEHPHLPSPELGENNIGHTAGVGAPGTLPPYEEPVAVSPVAEPLPIARSGDLNLMPPATGLPVGRGARASSLSGSFDNVPHAAEPEHEPAGVSATSGSDRHA